MPKTSREPLPRAAIAPEGEVAEPREGLVDPGVPREVEEAVAPDLVRDPLAARLAPARQADVPEAREGRLGLGERERGAPVVPPVDEEKDGRVGRDRSLVEPPREDERRGQDDDREPLDEELPLAPQQVPGDREEPTVRDDEELGGPIEVLPDLPEEHLLELLEETQVLVEGPGSREVAHVNGGAGLLG
jgi:hypothetical protein